MLVVLEKIISVFIIMGIGVLAAKLKLLPNGTKDVLIKLLLNITCPCMIIVSTTSHELNSDTLTETILGMVLSLAFSILMILANRVVSKHVLGMDNESSAVLSYTYASTNTGFFGFPVSLAVFGESVLYIFVVQNTILGLYLYFLGVMIMERFSTGKKLDMEQVKPILKNLCMWSCVISIIMLFAGIHIPEVIKVPMSMIGDATTPLSMILVGVMLSECDIKKLLTDKGMIGLTIFKMIVVPLLIFLALNWLPIPTTLKIGLPFAYAFPVAVMGAPMVDAYGHDAKQSVEAIGLTTLVSIVALPLIATFLTAYYGW